MSGQSSGKIQCEFIAKVWPFCLTVRWFRP